VDPEEFVEAGDRGAVIGRSRGLVRASGRTFDVRVVHVRTARGGKLARLDAYVDTPAMLQALEA
jgi:ketosteroid isomerase-like protein